MEQLIDLPTGGDCCISIMADIGEDAQEVSRSTIFLFSDEPDNTQYTCGIKI